MHSPVLGSVLGVAVLASCSPRDAAREAAKEPAAPHRLEMTAADYQYTMPDTVPAGLTTVVMHNAGPELHHVQLVRFEEGKTLADLGAAMDSSHAAPPWVVHLGGPQAVVPGDSSNATLELTPGHYAAICMIPSPGPDGVAHVAKGMAKEFVVVGEPPAGVVGPESDVTMTLTDYDFSLSGELTAGPQVIRVINTADQFHEVVIVRLAPGKRAVDLVGWIGGGMVGPPPGRPVGGTVALDSGRHNDIALNLEAGTYALLCFLPDAGDGRPHIEHGMMMEIAVT